MIDTYPAPPRSRVSEADEDLLNEIRDRYKSWDGVWQKIRQERNIDLRYICGDPWDPKDRKAREDASRPCINHDDSRLDGPSYEQPDEAVGTVRQRSSAGLRGVGGTPHQRI